MLLTLLLPSLLSLTLVSAENFPRLSPYSVHEQRSNIPHGWSRNRKHHAAAVLPLRFALSQSNIDKIDDFLNDVANPDSPNYGNHWTAGQIAATFAPSDDSIDTVRNWLSGNGFGSDRVKLTKTKGWIEVNATVEEAERLLLAEYHVYNHESGKEHVGSSCFRILVSCLTQCEFFYQLSSL